VDYIYERYLSRLSQTRVVCYFEKLDGVLVPLGDRHTCHIEAIGTVRVKLSDEMIRELKDVMYVLQLNKKLISVGALEEAQGLKGIVGEDVLKMFSGSLVVLKSIRVTICTT